MYAEYKKETDKSYMVLEAGQTEEDFSTRMLLENRISGLVDVEKRSFNGESYFFYDITGKHTLKNQSEKELLRADEIRKLLRSLYCVSDELHNHFLEIGGLLPEADYIYAEENTFCFCYYPGQESISTEEMLKIFAEQLLEITDHDDDGAVELVYGFYKMVKESEKGIMRILEEVLLQESNAEDPEEEQIEEIYIFDNESEETEKKNFLKDSMTLLCFSAMLLVSLCYLRKQVFPGLPKTMTDMMALTSAILSLPGIALGFVDIERKK